MFDQRLRPMTRLMHPPERDLHRPSNDFDPVDEGARYRLAPELAPAIWERVCADATDSAGRRDEEQAERRFHELAVRIAARGGRLRREVGRQTRVQTELEGVPVAATAADQLAVRRPGRETLVEREARRWSELDRASGAQPAIQARLTRAAGPLDRTTATEAIAIGTSGAAGRLPFLDILQPLFGHHDLGAVRAHSGSAAATGAGLLGAQAFATGDHVVFGDAPSLHTVAHEAAHVIQQRAGIQLAGGLGEVDDRYERQADLIADRVVRGEPVVDVFEGVVAGPGAASAGVQRQIRISSTNVLSSKSEKSEVERFIATHAADNPAGAKYLRDLISEDREVPLEEALRDMPAAEVALVPARAETTLSDDIAGILGKLVSSGEFVFNNPPLESSGDIYHTVGFLAIMREAGLTLPRVVIGYHPPANRDSPTWLNASRAVEFAAAIGFGAQVTMLQVARGKSSQLNPKLKDMRKAIAAANDEAGRAHHPILDQKVSTALIARLMQVLGRERITAIIEQQTTAYREGTPAATQRASDQWQEAQMVKIRACAGDGALILFNERIADNQEQHNSEGADFDAIRDQLLGIANLAVYTLRSHSGGAPEGGEHESSPAFAGAGGSGDQWALEGFNTKVQHLQLLARIKAEFGKRLIGIYGSTSGTLDAAALIGIRTLSLHQFSVDAKEKSGGLNEQDQRELLMAPFKSVIRREVGAKADEHAIEALEQWLLHTYAGAAFSPEEIGPIKPVYSRANTRRKTKSFTETGSALPRSITAGLGTELEPMRAGIEDALAAAQSDEGNLPVTRGAATGVGMNCLIHTMVQLSGNAPAGPTPQVAAIRQLLIDAGAAIGDAMLDPYQAGAGAALMDQFRRDGGFATQILQWQGGQLLVHPVIGNGPVRLLLHAGNHFEPVWGNHGVAIQVTAGVGGGDVAGGRFEDELARAIAESLRGSGKPAKPSTPASEPAAPESLASSSSPSPSPMVVDSSSSSSPSSPLSSSSSSPMQVDLSGWPSTPSSAQATDAIRHATVVGPTRLNAPANDVPASVREGTILTIKGRTAIVTAVTRRIMDTSIDFRWA